MYTELASRTQTEDIALHVSYLEIYQETGYDLLNPAAQMPAGLAVGLPKVGVF